MASILWRNVPSHAPCLSPPSICVAIYPLSICLSVCLASLYVLNYLGQKLHINLYLYSVEYSSEFGHSYTLHVSLLPPQPHPSPYTHAPIVLPGGLPELREERAREALSAGKNVLCERPIAFTLQVYMCLCVCVCVCVHARMGVHKRKHGCAQEGTHST